MPFASRLGTFEKIMLRLDLRNTLHTAHSYSASVLDKRKCPVCRGVGKIELLDTICSFCNGTGAYSKTAESYFKSHICQCVLLDRKRCPLCGKRCHHDTPNRPKILVEPM